MKKILLFIIIIISSKINSQVSFIGFDTVICGSSINHTYTYTDWSSGAGSGTTYGFTIYKNGQPVYSNSGQMADSKFCKDLVFINDSTGFLVFYSGNTGNRLLKTKDFGATWNIIGGGAPDYFGLYAINANLVYLVTYWYSPIQLYVSRCSDIQATQSQFIYDTSITQDIYKTDSIIGQSLCNRNSLKIFVKNNTDTVIYNINIFSLPVGIKDNSLLLERGFKLVPNPTKEFFKINNSSLEITSVNITALDGKEITKFNSENITQNFYPLLNITNGLYIVKLSTKQNDIYLKLSINN